MRRARILALALITFAVLVAPASGQRPALRLLLLVKVDGAQPPAAPPSPTCISSWSRATVAGYGRDKWRIRRATFVLAGRVIATDTTTPFQTVIHRGDLVTASERLLVRVDMRDGRHAEVVRRLLACPPQPH